MNGLGLLESLWLVTLPHLTDISCISVGYLTLAEDHPEKAFLQTFDAVMRFIENLLEDLVSQM
eukprot:gene2888-3528_t